MDSSNNKRLFVACFIALIATAFGFIIRSMVIDDWARQFGLNPTERGEILGVGLWPFAISIVLFSLVIDRIGYGRAIVFAFLCHVGSAIIAMCAPLVSGNIGQHSSAYWMLYLGNFVVALGNGTVEAVANPVVATMFSRDKTKWLNILHAGWPGGLVLGGLLTIGLTQVGIDDWRIKVALIFIPTILYGALMLGCRFPVNERVVAGVPYRAMLQEAGFLGAMIVLAIVLAQVYGVFGGDWYWYAAVWGILVLAYGAYVQALGRVMFVFLLLVMIPLATTELGVDSWSTDLMGPEMTKLGYNAGWVLVYTSFVMMILRFCAGPIVHRISPLGLLACCAAIAAVGIFTLSLAAGVGILAAATLYALGKSFFWPTQLGVVSEQFPRGGALTLNTMGGVGMLAVGVLGAPLLGNIQDLMINKSLRQSNEALYQRVQGTEKLSVFGKYQPVDPDKVQALPDSDRQTVVTIQNTAKLDALRTFTVFPCIMFVCYVSLIFYFRGRGGYRPIELETEPHKKAIEAFGTPAAASRAP